MYNFQTIKLASHSHAQILNLTHTHTKIFHKTCLHLSLLGTLYHNHRKLFTEHVFINKFVGPTLNHPSLCFSLTHIHPYICKFIDLAKRCPPSFIILSHHYTNPNTVLSRFLMIVFIASRGLQVGSKCQIQVNLMDSICEWLRGWIHPFVWNRRHRISFVVGIVLFFLLSIFVVGKYIYGMVPNITHECGVTYCTACCWIMYFLFCCTSDKWVGPKL